MTEAGTVWEAGRQAKRTMRERASSRSRRESTKVGYLRGWEVAESREERKSTEKMETHLSLMIWSNL